MADHSDKPGLEEGFQRFDLADATAFTRLMLELYDFRCAVTGTQFIAVTELPHPDLDVYLLRPLSEGGLLTFGNALVVERTVAGLLDEGQIVITDDYDAVPRDGSGGTPILRHFDQAFWPSPEALAYHRQRVGK